MKYFKNFLPLIFLFFTTDILQAKRMGPATTITQTRVQPSPIPAPVVKQPTIQSSAPFQVAPKPTAVQQQISLPKTYAEALAYIKTNMQAGDVFIGNTFTQKFINFVKSLDLYFVEREALLQAGISLYAPWTGNDDNDRKTLYLLKNTIESIIQEKPTISTQPTLPSKPLPQPSVPPKPIQLPQQPLIESKPIIPVQQIPIDKPLTQPTISKGKVPQDLFHKVKKLEGYDDIYVGAGTSAAGETIYFGMEKLNAERVRVWKKYINILYTDYHRNVIKKLRILLTNCDKAGYKDQQNPYTQNLMSFMCSNKQKFSALFGGSGQEAGIGAGITGFDEMCNRVLDGFGGNYIEDKNDIYVVYASSQPITGPFKPKKELNIDSYTLEDFETAYSDIIICVCVDMLKKLSSPVSTEHRGIFKNPFSEIRGRYKNIGLKLHGWAGTVEKEFFNKKYMTVFPTDQAGKLLHRAVPKGGGLYLGTDKQPFRYDVYYGTPAEQQAIKEKFPPIKSELIGDVPTKSKLGSMEDLHVFDLNELSKYYTEQQ